MELKVHDNGTIESSCFFTHFDKEKGIVYTRVKAKAEVQIDQARENSAAVEQVSDGKVHPILVDISEIKSISKESRDFFSMRNKKKGVNAVALVVNSELSKIIGNFFIGRSKPSVPTRLFTIEEKALVWLQGFVAEQ